MTPAQYARLHAIKIQLDALLGELGQQPAMDVSSAAPATAPTPAPPPTAEPSGGFGGRRQPVETCEHPKAKRESIGGFGAGPGRWHCGECGNVQTEG